MQRLSEPQWVITTRAQLEAYRAYCQSTSVEQLLRCPRLTFQLTNRFLIMQLMVDQLGQKLVNGGYAHA